MGLPGQACLAVPEPPSHTHPCLLHITVRVPSAEWYREHSHPLKGESLNHPAVGDTSTQGAGSGPWQVGPS